MLDERLQAALHDMTIGELRSVQATVYDMLGDGPLATNRLESADLANAVEPQSNVVADWLRTRQTRDGATKVLMLLGALAVAIAWWKYRDRPASIRDLRQAILLVDEGHPYLLPVPRCDPCFCGSNMRFKCCHGRPPNAVPAI